MHNKEVEILKKRAVEFLAQSKLAIEKGHNDSASFLADQAVQLYLKSCLLQVVGDYPRTHGIRNLIDELLQSTHSMKVSEFTKENRAGISSLEDACIMARYTMKEYDEETSSDAVKLAEQIMGLVEESIKEWESRRGSG
jgi:HEPN domain-containing protein